MRKFLLLLLVSPLSGVAQQNFEGTIRYVNIIQQKDSGYNIHSFGKTKVKMDIYDHTKRDFLETTIINDFDKGLSLLLIIEEKPITSIHYRLSFPAINLPLSLTIPAIYWAIA